MIIAVDFDGTICEHVFPRIGPEVPWAFATLRRLIKAEHKLILWTMRSDKRADGTNPLSEAIDWCRRVGGVEFWGINANGEQRAWTDSPKAYAQMYIDDAAFGCPLIPGTVPGGRPMVNWSLISRRLQTAGLIPPAGRYQYNKNYYVDRSRKGLCHRCGKRPLATGTQCNECRAVHNAKAKARYDARKLKAQAQPQETL